MTKTTWCPLPWMSLNVRSSGDVRVCCNANTSLNQGLISKSDGSTYNLGKDNLRDHLNANLLKEIRLSMLKNQYHPSCIRCEREDKSGIESRKEWEKKIWENQINFQKAKELTEADGSIDTNIPIRYADLRFGNLCNLACRSCGPTDSNQWYKEYKELWNTDEYDDGTIKVKLISTNKGRLKPINDTYNWHNNSKFWEQLEKEIPYLEKIYVVGGEPLLINKHYDFLYECIKQNRSKNIVVEYNSNITNIPQRAWEVWKHFKKITMGVSIDGIGAVNEYIRFPSKWIQIEKNLKKLDVAEGNFEIRISTTVQVYNILHLPELMLWKIKQKFNRVNSNSADKLIITPHPLHKPNFLNIKIFPYKSKLYIFNHFENIKKEYKEKIYDLADIDNKLIYKNFCKVLDNYTHFMMADDYSNHLTQFWHFTNFLDEKRNQSLEEVSPLTFQLLK